MYNGLYLLIYSMMKGTAMKRLTQREYEALSLLVKGLSNEEIAEAMFVTKHTVKMYLKAIYEKLEVSNRVSAVVKALSLGLIQIEMPPK